MDWAASTFQTVERMLFSVIASPWLFRLLRPANNETTPPLQIRISTY
jgi:hypothetical protein